MNELIKKLLWIIYIFMLMFCLFCIFYGICYNIIEKQVIQETLDNCNQNMTVEICKLEIKKAQKLKEYIKLNEEQKVLINEDTTNR